MVLHVCDYLRNLFYLGRFQVDQVICYYIILKVPQMDSEIVRREESFSVWAHAQRINIIIVTISKLRLFNSFIVLTLDFRGWKDDLVPLDLTLCCLGISGLSQAP